MKDTVSWKMATAGNDDDDSSSCCSSSSEGRPSSFDNTENSGADNCYPTSTTTRGGPGYESPRLCKKTKAAAKSKNNQLPSSELVVVWDWDDTLFPTSAYRCLQQVASSRQNQRSSFRESLARFLTLSKNEVSEMECESMYEELMETASRNVVQSINATKEWGHCYIVSNGSEEWLKACILSLSEEAQELLRDPYVHIFSASKLWGGTVHRATAAFNVSPFVQATLWKTMCMKQILTKVQNSQCPCSPSAGRIGLISIGDSVSEELATLVASVTMEVAAAVVKLPQVSRSEIQNSTPVELLDHWSENVNVVLSAAEQCVSYVKRACTPELNSRVMYTYIDMPSINTDWTDYSDMRLSEVPELSDGIGHLIELMEGDNGEYWWPVGKHYRFDHLRSCKDCARTSECRREVRSMLRGKMSKDTLSRSNSPSRPSSPGHDLHLSEYDWGYVAVYV